MVSLLSLSPLPDYVCPYLPHSPPLLKSKMAAKLFFQGNSQRIFAKTTLALQAKSPAPISYFNNFPPSLFNCSAFNLLFFVSVCLIAMFCTVEQSVVCTYKLYLHVRSTDLTGRQGKCLRGLWKNALDRGVFFFFFFFSLCFWLGLFDCVSVYSLMAKLKWIRRKWCSKGNTIPVSS